jgi:threonine aldolase
MATRLAAGVDGIAGVRVTDAVQANAVFAILDPRAVAELQAEFAFYTWNEATHQVRWMTSWATTQDDVDTFIARIREVAPTYA